MSQIYNRKFYPTPATVTYYIGDLWIDDIYRVDYQRKVTHQPIWGYDSQRYDFIARGKEIVSGNIVVNYRYPGYLKAAIKKYIENKDANDKMVHSKFIDNSDSSYDPDFIKAFDASQPTAKLQLLSNQLNRFRSSPFVDEMISKLKDDMRKAYGANGPIEDTSAGDAYKSILDYDEIYPFDMIVRYGFQNVTGGYIRKFKDCVIIGESQTVSAAATGGDDLSSSSQPILEIYSFFAKTIETIKST